ncbi:MAG TPA: hypothetical protein VE646_04035 [Actinomycetota bacterium]|nr:hypothetical protein [Actinomycetota bacterium]
MDDGCREAHGVRGFALLKPARGDLDGATETMDLALTHCSRQRDTHLWLRACVLDGLCAVAVAVRHLMAERWISDLISLTARSEMHQLSARAYLYRPDLLGGAPPPDGRTGGRA